jgi:hypothetical protein
MTKTAVVKGLLKADLNLTNEEFEFAPQGTKLLFKIEVGQFTNLPTFSDNYLIYETMVQGAGQYQISLPVNDKGIEVFLLPEDFEYDQIYEFFNPNTNQFETGTRRIVFKSDPINMGALITGQEKIFDITYSYQE